MDRLQAMTMLVEAIEGGSMSAASRKLGVPLPTLSRNISDLEAHLGTQLLIRSTRRLTLTEAGAAYVTASKIILDQVGDAERAAAGEYRTPKGDLVVTTPIVFGRRHVLPVLTDFLATYPEINVRLVLSDRNVHLIDDHIDMAVRVGELPDSSMTATRVGTVRRIVCGSPAYFAANGIPDTPDDISRLPCVTHDYAAPSTFWSFKVPKDKLETQVPIHSRLSVTTAEAAIDAAIAGVGLTRLLSYQAAPAIARNELQIVLAAFETKPLPISLLHAGHGLLPLKMRSFLDFAAPRLRTALTDIQKATD